MPTVMDEDLGQAHEIFHKMSMYVKQSSLWRPGIGSLSMAARDGLTGGSI